MALSRELQRWIRRPYRHAIRDRYRHVIDHSPILPIVFAFRDLRIFPVVSRFGGKDLRAIAPGREWLRAQARGRSHQENLGGAKRRGGGSSEDSIFLLWVFCRILIYHPVCSLRSHPLLLSRRGNRSDFQYLIFTVLLSSLLKQPVEQCGSSLASERVGLAEDGPQKNGWSLCWCCVS